MDPQEYVPPGLVALSEQECWDLLATARTGHLALEDRGRILVIPVDYVLDGTTVVFRIPEGSPVDVAAGWGRPAAFQADRIGDDQDEAWTVLVQGELRRASEDDTDRLGPVASRWFRSGQPSIGRISGEVVVGRRVPPA